MLIISFFLTLISILRYIDFIFTFYITVNFFIKLIYLIKYLIKYPYKKRLKLSYLRSLKREPHMKYKIHDHNELDITITLLFLYNMFFILLLFISRISNMYNMGLSNKCNT